ncbi:M14 family zinc carboxypeptidase [Bernardetia sp. ABR2-2B]|uniref:M14 family zinc carboxypeptidase n=1 Tax=Bernardetia sp. ABR2-2B TaxID=3127472 RepID=UPI0030CE1AA3
MKKISLLLSVFLFSQFAFLSCSMAQQNTSSSATNFSIPFDTNTNQTVTYQEGIKFLNKLETAYPQFLKVNEFGMTDSGEPLHEIIFEINGKFNTLFETEKENKFVVFINNGIHPGESDGVDATFMLLRDLCTKEEVRNQYKNIVLVVIPFYNISGTLTRNSTTRANQNGAEEYGFRGNVKNLDLNRDFVKCDSKNGESFNKLFQKWQPLVYLENHVSNGADYQYTMTHLATQADKLGGKMGSFLNEKFTPALEKAMISRDEEMTPYVNVFGYDPLNGWEGFMDSPRYSTGYAALFQTFSMLTETHMLKPYDKRVKATSIFMEELLKYVQENGLELQKIKNQDQKEVKIKKEFVLDWELDKERFRTLNFKGYESSLEKSKVSGLDRMKYDRSKPYQKEVKYYDAFKPSFKIDAPKAYLIPLAYTKVLERLKWNGVKMDTLINEEHKDHNVEVYSIENYKTSPSAYESHYLHYEVEVSKEKMSFEDALRYPEQKYILVKLNQKSNRYIIEMLEPQAKDSFFAWNFFDGILQQKEHFSPYVFEDVAAQILEENPELRKKLEDKKVDDEKFAKNAYLQLEFVYQHSIHYEKTHLKYPVLRVVE